MTLEQYYRERAEEYEHIYHRPDPVRQSEQWELADAVRSTVAGKRVLEVACGTGYWTQFAAETAAHVTATDVAEETLGIARAKGLPPTVVDFRIGDAFALSGQGGPFTAGLGMFWLSHVPRSRIAGFLRGFHATLDPGATVLLADNMYVEGVGGVLAQAPGEADTYKLRTLRDGSTHRILKNYFGEEELRHIFAEVQDLSIAMRTCFWWVEYRTPA